MKLLFVAQEEEKVPSGVVTVLLDLCRGWSERDEINILINEAHWAGKSLLSELKDEGKIRSIKYVPSILISNFFACHLLHSKRWKKIMTLIIFLPLLVVQLSLLFIWLIGWLRINKIQGILSHNGGWPGGILNRWIIFAGMFAGVKHRVLVIHNTPVIYGSVLTRAISLFSAKIIGMAATKIVTVSRACRDSLVSNGGFSREIDVVYNGSLANELNVAPINRDSIWRKRYPTIGFVGEIHPRKGVHILLEALQLVQCRCELILVGNGDASYTKKLKELAKASNHPIQFLGYCENVNTLYPKMDLLVLPSLCFESFGMVLIEAMKFEIPVICSDFGGMKEVVVNDVTGFVVPAGDVYVLASKIEQILVDDSLRMRLGVAGKLRVNKFFTSELMTNNYERYYVDN